jgi:hypothetical protein
MLATIVSAYGACKGEQSSALNPLLHKKNIKMASVILAIFILQDDYHPED